MEEINKRGFTKKNLKRLFSFGKDDILWLKKSLIFIILFLVIVYAYSEDTKDCRRTLADPDFQECSLYTRAVKTAEILREQYPGAMVNCYPELGKCEVSGVRDLPGMPTKEDLDALNISGIIFNNSE